MFRASLTTSIALVLTACFDPSAVEDTDGDTSASSGSGAPTTTPDDDGGPGGTMSTTGTPMTDGTGDSTGDGPAPTTDDGPSTDDGDSTGGRPPPATACAGTWHPWFSSSFEYPDGGIVGTADVPSSPWGTPVGAATIEDGRLVTTGDSTLISSHGQELSIDGLRLRYTAIFGDTDNAATIGFNADMTGAGGLGVTLRASDGELAIVEDGATVDAMVLGALQPGTEYFIEFEIAGQTANLWLSTGNYATVPGGELIISIENAPVFGATDGRWVWAELADSAAGSPAIDDVEVARCDQAPPEYEEVFVDTFNRPNNATVGNAELPAGSVWNEYTTDADIFGNRLRLQNGFSTGIRAQASAAIGVEQARLRAVVSFGATANSPWPTASWGVNGAPDSGPRLGFVLWNNGNDGHVILQGYGGGIETPFPDSPFAASTDYYVEVSIDGNYGVATVRTGSFTGPVYAAAGDSDIVAPPATANEVSVQSLGGVGSTFYVDEVRLARYPVQ